MNACLWLVLMIPTAATDSPAWPYGENLLVNGDFEAKSKDKTIPGWTLTQHPKGCARTTLDKKAQLQGLTSLQLSVPGAGASAAKARPVAVRPGALLLVAYAYRQEGFSPGTQYHGVSAYLTVEWYEEKGKGVSRESFGNRYAPTDWEHRDLLLRVPREARTLHVSFTLSNGSKKFGGTHIPSTLSLDTMQVRVYTPPPTPAEAIAPAERIVQGGISSTSIITTFLANEQVNRFVGSPYAKAVADPKAERGTAVVSPKDCGKGFIAHSPTLDALPPGLYRLLLRAKVADNTNREPVAFLDIVTKRYGLRLKRTVLASDFAKSNTYQWIQVDFTSRGAGYWIWRLSTAGKQPITVDNLRVAPLMRFSDSDLLTLFPGSEGTIDPKLTVSHQRPMRVLLVAGPFWDTYGLVPVIRSADGRTEFRRVWIQKQYAQVLQGFPKTVAELFKHNLICLFDVDLKSLSLQHRQWLRAFVQRGGALVVFGGHQSYARGRVAGSLLEDVLPVTCASGQSDWTRPPADATLVPASDSPLLSGLDFSRKPRVYFMHETTPKKDAIVVLKVADTPALVLGRYGKGRVVCLLATTHGAPAQGETPFWRWTGWPTLLRNVIWWTTGEDRRFQEK